MKAKSSSREGREVLFISRSVAESAAKYSGPVWLMIRPLYHVEIIILLREIGSTRPGCAQMLTRISGACVMPQGRLWPSRTRWLLVNRHWGVGAFRVKNRLNGAPQQSNNGNFAAYVKFDRMGIGEEKQRSIGEEKTMLKTFGVALLAIAMSVGWAQAMGMRHMHRHVIPGCAVGQPAAATCACGTVANRPLLCRKGQWCHPSQACTA